MTTKDRVLAYFAAANEDRTDDVLATFHEDAVLDVPAQSTKRGSAQIRRFYESVPRRFPEHYDDPVLVLAEGNDAMAAILFTGRTREGRPARFWAADKFRFEDGKIRELRVMFDPAGLGGVD